MKFHASVKGIRRKELPESNDEFAQDLGDYRTVDELREAIRKGIFAQRQYEAQQEAKNQMVDKLVDAHDFPVPRSLRGAAGQEPRGAEPARHGGAGHGSWQLKLDWEKVKETQRDKAVREVKASLLLGQDRESGEPSTPPATKWTGKWSRLPARSASRWPRCR